MKLKRILAVTVFISTVLGYGQAEADISKEACVMAHSNGQDARDQGKLTLAKTLFMTCSQNECPSIVRDECAQLADELVKRQPTVTFVARSSKGADLPNTTVFVDGELVLTNISSGSSMDIDPGQHNIRFVHGDKEQTETIIIQSGEKARTILATFELTPKNAVVPNISLVPELPVEGPDDGVSRPVGAYLLTSLGVATIIGGGVVTYLGMSDVPDGCSISSAECAVPPGHPDLKRASDGVTKMNRGLIIAGIGVAATVGGVLWFYLGATHKQEEQPVTQIMPFLSTKSGGFAVKNLLNIFSSLCFLSMFVHCSTNFTTQGCDLDSDCDSSYSCVLFPGEGSSCVATRENPIVIGQSAAVSGTNQILGIEMKRGIDLAIDEVNQLGGVHGRKIVLEFRDDGYEPIDAEAAARDLVKAVATNASPKCPSTTKPVVAGQQPISTTALERGRDGVFAVIGSVGTPTMVRAAPVVVEAGALFFGAFTGAGPILRDDQAGRCQRFIFNIRASYAQEALATTLLFKNRGITKANHYISFDQNDSFGQAGYDGLIAAYKSEVGNFPNGSDPVNPIKRFRYTRNNDSSVPAQAAAATTYLAGLLGGQAGNHSVGVLMTDTAGAGAAFIKALRDWQYADDAEQNTLNKANRLRIIFSNLSFVGPDALADNLIAAGTTNGVATKPYTEDVVVSQVVPNYDDDQSVVVNDYNSLSDAAGFDRSFTALEGYISMRVFIAGLKNHAGSFDPNKLVSTFENLPELSLGLGATAGFTPNDHQYSKSVWGTTINTEGRFVNLYFWSVGRGIQFF